MGLNFFNIFLLGGGFTAFVVSAGFITDASRRIGNLPELKTNKDLTSAHRYSYIAAIIAWISVTLFLIAIILIFVYGSEFIVEGGFSNYLILGSLFFVLSGAALVGVLSAITASEINKAKISDNGGAYKQAIIATIIGIFSFVAILIAFFVKIFYKPKKKIDVELTKLESEAKEVAPEGLTEEAEETAPLKEKID